MFYSEENDIDKEALRVFVSQQLLKLRDQYIELLEDEQYQQFWDQLHDLIATTKDDQKEKREQLYQSFRVLPKYIQDWINKSVANQEMFEFFITSKAEEIKSGNQDHDYFWAIQIRHDQLVAVIHVLARLYQEMSHWVKLKPRSVLDHPVFLGLLDYSIDEQVYLEAEQLHKNRQKESGTTS